jgi:hypothetical protein
MTRGRMGARAPRTCRRPATVVLLGTALLKLTGSFQAPGHQIYLHSLLRILELCFQTDCRVNKEGVNLFQSKWRRDQELSQCKPRCGSNQNRNIDRTRPGLDKCRMQPMIRQSAVPHETLYRKGQPQPSHHDHQGQQHCW